MAKSRYIPPGDSAPDFSHLAGQGPEKDDGSWPAADESDASSDAAPEHEAAGPPADDDPSSPAPSPRSTERSAGTPGSSGDSHVFFDVEGPLSADQMLGETLALDSASAPVPHNPLDAASVFEAAPDADEPGSDRGAQTDSQLTDVGIPCFDPPPEIAEPGPANEGDRSRPSGQAEIVSSHKQADIPVPPQPSAPVKEPRATSATVSPAAPAPQRSHAAPAGDRQRLMVILLASYASAMTIAALWLWLNSSAARPHELESLPDVAPLEPNEFRYAPQNASMPQGHTLPLGTAQQLGYIKVEPLRVTRGPVRFSHYSDQTQSKPPTAPVLKLWLRFTNVSSDQLIAPLDRDLLLTRSYQHERDAVLANQLLLPADKASQKPGYVIDHPLTSEWDLAGQHLGNRLKPGESVETYIPLEPGSADHLTGDLLWRVHFRKGYHDATGHGVTTMIEVPFSTADVQVESARAS